MKAIYDCVNCKCHDCQFKDKCGRCSDHEKVRNNENCVFNPCVHCTHKARNVPPSWAK